MSKTEEEASEDLLPLADLRDDPRLLEGNELSVLVLAVELLVVEVAEPWLDSLVLSWYRLL